MFQSLGEYQKAKEHHGKALAIKIEIGDMKGEGKMYRGAFDMEYHEKALAIAIKSSERKEEGRMYGYLGTVFQFLGEYQMTKEHYEKALLNAKGVGLYLGNSNLRSVFQSLSEYKKAKENREKALGLPSQ